MHGGGHADSSCNWAMILVSAVQRWSRSAGVSVVVACCSSLARAARTDLRTARPRGVRCRRTRRASSASGLRVTRPACSIRVAVLTMVGGDLTGSQPVMLPELAQQDVLADPDAVVAHRLVSGLTEQLGCLSEEGKQIGHRFSILASTLTTW